MLRRTHNKNRDLELMTKGKGTFSEDEVDRPLNYYSDQMANIRRRLSDLNLNQGVNGAIDLILLAAGVGFMVRRKYPLGSLFLAGLLLKSAMRGVSIPTPHLRPARDQNDIDVERYALKAERGDYGHLEVIPFR